MNDSSPSRPPQTLPAGLSYGAALVCLLLYGLVAQLSIFAEGLAENPFVTAPGSEAGVYWEWAGRIAGGELVGETPFLSAPLYPYLLGFLRRLGAGLIQVFGFQSVLHLATTVLLARVVRLSYGERAAIFAVLLYLLVTDVAFAPGRLLNGSLQLFLTVLVWERMLAFRACACLPRAAWLGLAAGVLCLAQPALLAALPALVLWAMLWGGTRKTGSLLLACVCLSIAPATLHNALASGEWTLISAQGGLTYAHGNQAGAKGTYEVAGGVSSTRQQQNVDARAKASRALGKQASWAEASSHFYGEGFAWQRANPGAAIALMGKKIWLFATARHYGDVYLPALEREAGIAEWLCLAPLPLAWLVLPSFVMLILLWRRRGLPMLAEELVLGIPFLVVMLFFYSPRYRLAASPAVCALAALALLELLQWRKARASAVAVALAFALAIGSGAWNLARGVDDVDAYRPAFELALGRAYLREGQVEESKEHFERAAELGHPSADAAIADVLRQEGRLPEAFERLAAAALEQPDDPFTLRSYAILLAQTGQAELAIPQFERVLELDPNDPRAEAGLGNALLSTGSADEALGHYERAVSIDPSLLSAELGRGLALRSLDREGEAAASFRAALERDPAFAPARAELASLLLARGEMSAAMNELRTGLSVAPDERLRWMLAWGLATLPDESERNGQEATKLVEEFDPENPEQLDTVAAILAENGQYEEASSLAERAIVILREAGQTDWANEIDARRLLYAAGRPFRQGL